MCVHFHYRKYGVEILFLQQSSKYSFFRLAIVYIGNTCHFDVKYIYLRSIKFLIIKRNCVLLSSITELIIQLLTIASLIAY